ncbi:hypothetical protein QE152_g13326 [Popillia japonica]|uniref:DDE-1 domain-containing protein n=1 Tax=Popillia japonica TaxID=7064 RepID=A0AAW1LED4_POPJA
MKETKPKPKRFIIQTIEDEGNQTQAKDVATSISLLTAAHMLKKRWEKVRCATIVNCFKKTGFVVNDGAQSLDENSDPADIDDLDDELRAWINMDEDVPVVKRNFIETIATNLLTTEDMEAAGETEDIEGSSSTPPTSTESHAALDVLRRSLYIRGATLEGA